MPDSYWENYAKELQPKKYCCPSCGGGTDHYLSRGIKCEHCSSAAPFKTLTRCGCGKEFIPTRAHKLRCPDCGSERYSPTEGQRISAGFDMLYGYDS